MVITFNELRRIKDKLPSGSSQRIADELGIDVDTSATISAGSITMPKEMSASMWNRVPTAES